MKRFLYLIPLILSLASCQQDEATLEPQILNTHPHDDEAFTQGLLFHDGYLFESTGLEGRSSLRQVDIETGEVIRSLPLADTYFGEGLAEVDGDLLQITWQSGEAFRYDLATFELIETYQYDGEGWGICYDGEALYMSDGSATLYIRDPETFELTSRLQVTRSGEGVAALNELECVDGHIYANIWQTDEIVKIDKKGRIVASIDAASVSAESGRGDDPNAVLNGIAYNPETQTFYLTGKLWPSLFEVRFEEAQE